MGLSLFGIAAALAFSAVGSALGIGTAGMAAIGSWKKCYAQNKQAPFLLVAFAGAPLTQTIYGLLLMNSLSALATNLSTVSDLANSAQGLLIGGVVLGAGVVGGLAMGFSAWYQGKAGAMASDALAETGKGTGNYFMILGLVESVALLTMVFLMQLAGSWTKVLAGM